MKDTLFRKHKQTDTAKLLTILGILSAMSIVANYIVHIPIIPTAPFLKYDPADIPILVGGFAFGPVAGLLITVVTCVVHAMTSGSDGGVYGLIMHIVATGTLVLVASLIYSRKHTKKNAVLGLVMGGLAMTLIMIPANYIVTPLFLGVPVRAVNDIIIFIILFNIIKSAINGTITFLLYKRISKYLFHDEKDKHFS